MPKLWTETIETHRHEVRHAIMDTTWTLATQHGPMSVTMSQVASEVGIGRATLYKYFPDVQAILVARHGEHVRQHLDRLHALRDRTDDPTERLSAVAHAYAHICHHRAQHGTLELSALTHQPEHVAEPEQQLRDLFEALIGDAVTAASVRTDIKPRELAIYCVHALGAASNLPNAAASNRLAELVLEALRPLPE
ncbi:AcrR family transcriptional regulator [Nocardioides sp. BE266]|uniref:TetR/AcrR family transcriptional regulator n=1 Tax=Nocardioides sp. BE266 TaxID=2817725 RepID=UPI0028547E95|nr:TetR/AcrR family transcriptional regulator [Nocardioides sp. BE266]MDR7253368.1 AcrR family transcriptional regulator [Nocardioides sp. BE266]